MGKSELPLLVIGDEVGGCIYLGRQENTESTRGGITIWKLRCICGYEFSRRASEHWFYAKNGKQKLCRNKHLHTDIKIGERFGKLVIKSFIKKEITGRRGIEMRGYAVCDCSCGQVNIEVLPESLRKGDTQSCGCYLKETTGDRFRTHGKTDTREFDLWAASKDRSNKEGIPFDIELTDISIPAICPVLGIPIDIRLGRGRRQPDSPSLDKFIPSKGYVKGNIQVISWRANWLKNNGTTEEWIKIAEWCQKEEIKIKLQDKENQ